MDFNDGIMAKGSLDEIRSAVDRLLADSVDVSPMINVTPVAEMGACTIFMAN